MAAATWIGTVTFRDTHRWLPGITVKTEASGYVIAVKKAARIAAHRLPKGTRVQGVCCKLERVAAPRQPKGHVTTDACRSNGCRECVDADERSA